MKFVEIVERLVAGESLDLVVDEIRWMLAAVAHDPFRLLRAAPFEPCVDASGPRHPLLGCAK
jgi:hypothetical protein